MTIYSERAGLSLLSGATDADGDPLTVRRVNGQIPADWPVRVALTRGSILVHQNGAVAYDDGGSLSGHPALGEAAVNGSFTFTLWDGQDESDTQSVDITLHGVAVAPTLVSLSETRPRDDLPAGSVVGRLTAEGTAPFSYELVSAGGLPLELAGDEVRTTGPLSIGTGTARFRASNAQGAREEDIPIEVVDHTTVLIRGQQDPALAPGPTGEAVFVSAHGTDLAPKGAGVYRHVDGAVAASGDGLTPGTAYRTIQEAVDAAQRGDTVLIRGAHGAFDGKYRESMNFLGRFRTPGDQTVFARHGAERVTITAAEPLPGWTACTDAADARGNPNWSAMFRTTVPASHPLDGFHFNLAQSDRAMMMNVRGDDAFFGTSTENMFFHGNTAAYFAVDSATKLQEDDGNGNSVWLLASAAAFGGHAGAGDLDGVWAGVHYNPGNAAAFAPIESFDPATDTVTLRVKRSITSLDGVAVVNDVAAINAPGQWGFLWEADGSWSVWCWPWDAGAMDEVEISARLFGINLDGATNLTLYGLDAVQASGPDLYDGTGIGATSNHVGITKRDCIIEECRADRNTGGGIISGDAEGFVVQNNTVRQVQAGRGLYVFGTGNRVLRNHVATTGGTGLTASLSIDSIFAFNRVEDVRGAHGNGMSCYQGCHNLLVFGNVIRTQKGIGLTHQDGGNLWFVMNDIQCPPDEVWGNRALENNANRPPATGDGPFVVNVINNTCGPAQGMTVPGGASAVIVGKTGNATHNTVNNATFGNTSWEFAGSRGDGSVKGDEIGNVLCGLVTSVGQSVTNPYFLSGDNLYQPDPSAMFAAWQAGDYRPLPGGVLDAAGQDASAWLPSGAWLDGFDMARDCDGRSFDWSVNPPVGAYLP